MGCAEQGRLGRIAELFVGRGGRRGLVLPLSADQVHTKNKRVAFAGDFLLFLGVILGCFESKCRPIQCLSTKNSRFIDQIMRITILRYYSWKINISV